MSTSSRDNPLDRLASQSPTPPADRWGIGAAPGWLEEPPQEPGADPEPHTDPELDDGNAGSRRRVSMAPPAAVALLAIAVIACAFAGFELFGDSASVPAVAFDTSPGPTESANSGPASPPVDSGAATRPAEVVVSVVGLVHRPGLVRLAAGSRVADAIARAGGARKGADVLSLNLAQVLHDGDQVLVGHGSAEGRLILRSAIVPGPGAGEPTSAAATAGPGSVAAPAGAKVNLNTAGEADLDALPGVGPVTAGAILEWRSRNGRFTSVDQLAEVDGIGPARLAKLRELVTV